MTQAEFSQGLELPHCSAYEAYQSLLRSLLLREFPCGLGEWREDHKLIQAEMSAAKEKGVSLRTLKPNLTDYTSCVTLKDVNAGTERTETLSELTRAKESPWFQTCDWTDEGAKLRELAVSEPWTLSQARVNCLLRTLKVHDKNVGEIDDKMKQLKNLEHLVITANYLSWIEGHNLPASLRVLELHGNFIDDLAGLTRKPPPNLEHLGVGRNNLTYIGGHLSGVYWPCLLSLDLSYNHLEDLKGLLECLATLPKLRSLVLAGNPLALTPWYRGFTIDQLRKLLTLDDAKISADERHNYKGMVRRKEFVIDQCQLQIRVNSLKNLPVPPEIASPEDLPEFPVIVRRYCLRFWLPFEDSSAARTGPSGLAVEDGADLAAGESADDADLNGKGKLRKSTGFMSDIPEEPPADEHGDSAANAGGRSVAHGASGPCESGVQSINGTLCSPVRSSDRVYAELTSPTDEAARDRIGWEGQFVLGHLRLMRDYLLHSVKIEIVEDKSSLYPPDQLPQDGQEHGKLQGGQDKKKDEKKDDSKPKKKKKIDEGSLVVHSTESTCLASVSIDLSELLTSPGQWLKLEVKSQTQSTGTPVPTVPSTPANADKRSKDAKGVAGKDDKKKDKSGKAGSAKPQGKRNPGKDPAGSTDDNEELAGEKAPPPVLAEVELQRVQWRSVKDCPTAVVIAVEKN